MNNKISKLFKLVKSGYQCKKNIKKYLKYDKNSQSYILATYYSEMIKEIEDNDNLNMEKIDTILNQINAHQVQYQGNEEVQQLLAHILSFFETVKPFVKENLA